MSGDYRAAARLALDFVAVTQSRISVISDLFEAANRYITSSWNVGDATTEDEFRVCIAISDALSALPLPVPTRQARPAASALLVTIRPEEHNVGLNLVATALRDDWWDVELVPNIDPLDLVDCARQQLVDLVGISSTYVSLHSRSHLSAAVRALHALGKRVIVGGQAFNRDRQLAGEIGADASAEDVRAAIVMARRLMAYQHRHRNRSHQTAPV